MKVFLLLLILMSCSSNSKRQTLTDSQRNPLEETLKQVNMAEYELKTMTVVDTSFHLFGKTQGGLGLDRIERALIKMWPALSQNFSNHPDEVAIVEMEGDTKIGQSQEFQIQIVHSDQNDHKILNKYYSKFRNPKQAYTDDLVMHALVQLFIVQNKEGQHFKSGLRLLYAQLAWSSIIKISSVWKNAFATPDELNALNTVNELRNEIGADAFDKAIDQLSASADQGWNFEDFMKLLPEEKRAQAKGYEKRLQN
jgi:hypothetical protein